MLIIDSYILVAAASESLLLWITIIYLNPIRINASETLLTLLIFSCPLKLIFIMINVHKIRLTVCTTLKFMSKVLFGGIKHIPTLMQPSPLSISCASSSF
jgi:cytochrome bd-type quinol oxidase subunit 2